MRLTIELPDDQIAGLQAKAESQGLSIQEWLVQLATGVTPSPEQRAQIAVARIRAIQQRSNPDPDGLTVLDYIHQSRRE